MTLNAVIALILRLFTEFDRYSGRLHHSGWRLTYNLRKSLAPSSSVLLLAKTITHPAALSLCDSWASCFTLDVLYDRLTELHAAHQNLPLVIRTLRLKKTIQNIHQIRTKSDNMIRTLALCRIWHNFVNRSNLFITYFQCLMGFSCV